MKIAVSSTAPNIDADIDPRFGRCEYFLLIDPDTMEFEAVENSSMMASGGAGIATAQMIAKKGVELVLTGNCGPNAHQTLSASGIPVITGVSGKIKAAIEAYKNGQYQTSSTPNVDAHFGTGGAVGSELVNDMGAGMGRGMGKGRGMGMRGGMMQSGGTTMAPAGAEQEIQILKDEFKMMAQQLADIQRRIGELEKKSK